VSSRLYRLAPRADVDLEEIWSYSASLWSPAKADEYVGDLIAAFADLASGLRKGTPTTARADYRRLLVGTHAIFYRETSTRIDVIRVLHQNMDSRRHL
jgi:toxin ParE1/3/4